ncbi:MAG: T9SS C-terminal target domain-containing protein [Balneolaceae bacterium]|nr:MAG: T9SS C-terminal target domain-containing protein [Balneolaceae bacterium]
MKLLYAVALLFVLPLFSPPAAYPQEHIAHPLEGFEDFLRTDDLILFWTEGFIDIDSGDPGRQLFSQIIYSNKKPGVDELIFQQHNNPPNTRYHRYNTAGFQPHYSFDEYHPSPVDVVTGDFNGDGYETFVGAYAGNRAIHFVLHELNPQRMTGDNVDNFDIQISNYAIRTATNTYRGGLFRLAAADLTRNGRDEVILAYRTQTNYMIEVFSITEDLNLVRIAYHDAGPFPAGYSAFDIAAGKLTMENSRELVFAFAAPGSTENNVLVNTQVLFAQPNGSQLTLTPGETREVYNGSILTTTGININAVTGDFTGNVVDEIAVGFNIWKSSRSGDSDDNLFVRVLDLADGDLAVWPAFNYEASIVNEMAAFSMVSADIDGTGQDEIILTNDGLALILKAPVRPEIPEDFDLEDDNGNDDNGDARQLAIYIDQLLDFAVALESARYTSRYITAADLNQNRELILTGQGGFTTEIVAINSDIASRGGEDYRFRMNVYGTGSSQTSLSNLFSEIFELRTQEANEGPRSYAIAGGDFTLSRIRYLNPRRSQLTEIRQPWIILKAPPTHFDIFGDNVFDVNRCFGSNCGFQATFTSTETQGRSVTTSVESDWSVSAGAEGLVKMISFGIEAKYGRGFGHSNFRSERETFSQSRTARDTDQVYAAVSTFDLWEYDVYDSEGFVGTVLAVIPTGSSNTWLSSDSFFGFNYRSLTEETNLLSYPRNDAVLQDNNIRVLLKGLRTEDPSYSIDGSSGTTWTLEFEDFQEDESYNRSSFSIGGSLGLPKLGLSLSGEYNTTSMETNKMMVSETIKIEVELGAISPQFPTAQYIIYPYAYWHEDGPLVIDYAVRLDKQLLGGPRSFWDDWYGSKPDPALKLPWRHLETKSVLRSGNDNVEFDRDILELTKSIRYYPPRVHPGDTVTVEIDVHNFSLVELVPPVDVHLYFGNPDGSGQRLTFVDGSDVLQTEPLMPIRGRKMVTGQFVMPESIPQPRLFAVLDPDNKIDEIHTRNNRGYVPVSTTATLVSADDEFLAGQAPTEFRLYGNYPNPFNPSTRIAFALPGQEHVRLEVYDVLGRRVALLVDEVRAAGQHSVDFDATALTSGVYLYRITAGDFNQTRKMMLMK